MTKLYFTFFHQPTTPEWLTAVPEHDSQQPPSTHAVREFCPRYRTDAADHGLSRGAVPRYRDRRLLLKSGEGALAIGRYKGHTSSRGFAITGTNGEHLDTLALESLREIPSEAILGIDLADIARGGAICARHNAVLAALPPVAISDTLFLYRVQHSVPPK